jgi:hypothetical protein
MNYRGMISELWLLWTIISTVLALVIAAGYCQANPVPEARLNPFMTEDDVIALMYRWKIGVRKSIRVRGRNPRPCVRVTGIAGGPCVYPGLCYYHLGVDFGNPHWMQMPGGSGDLCWYEMPDPDGFMDMGMGRTLEAAIKNAAYSGNLPQAERDEVLRRK